MRAWPPVRRRKRRKSQKQALSGNLGLLCAEQSVRNLKKCTFRNSGTPVRRTKRQKPHKKCTVRKSGTPVRRTKRRKSQKMDSQGFWDSCAQNKTSKIKKMHFQEFWVLQDVGNLKKNARSRIMGLLCAPQTPQKALRALGCKGWSLFA